MNRATTLVALALGLLLALLACGGGAEAQRRPDHDVRGTIDTTGESDALAADDVVGTPDPTDEAVEPLACRVDIPCVGDTDCEPGQHCNSALTPPNCQTLYCGEAGTVCDETPLCNSGLTCVGDRCAQDVPVPTCATVATQLTPCGGTVTGTWTYTLGCISGAYDPMNGACPAGQMASEMAFGGATVTFAANGSYTSTSAPTNVTTTITVPVACLGAAGGPCQRLSEMRGKPGSCQQVGDACTCTTVTQTSNGQAANGTYQASGTTFVLHAAAQEAMNGSYCVAGNVLLVSLDEGSSIGPTYLVFTR